MEKGLGRSSNFRRAGKRKTPEGFLRPKKRAWDWSQFLEFLSQSIDKEESQRGERVLGRKV